MASCAPCVFGAVSTQLLSYPIAIGTVDVQIIPQVTIVGNGSASTTGFITSTLAAANTAAGGAAVSTVTFTDPSQITWSTLGTVLTYPTTYVDYAGFAGVAAATGCATSLNPTPLTLPPSVPSASLIYPLDNTGALPAGLINFLDGAGGIPAQLSGDQITQCASLAGALPISGTIQSVITAVPTATSGPVTVTSDIPPPTTFTSESTRSFTSLATVPASNAVTQASGVLFNTVTAGPVVYSGSVSTSLSATALSANIGSSLKSVLSSLSSLSSSAASVKTSQTGVFTNTTSGQTQPSSRATIPPTASSGKPSSGIVPSSSKTSIPALYSGAAVRLPSVSNSIIADIFGFVAFMLYI